MTLETISINENKHIIAPLDDIMPLMRRQLADGKSVKFTPTGISMMPMLRHNKDSVTVAPVYEGLNIYDIVLYQRDNGDYVLHRMVGTSKVSGETNDEITYTMLGDNQFQKEYGIRFDQVIGVVTKFARDEHEHNVDESGYKLYCRVWYHSRHFRHFWLRAKRKIKRLIG